jgi:hypothetical protein
MRKRERREKRETREKIEKDRRERERGIRTDTGVDQSRYESHLMKQAEHRAAKHKEREETESSKDRKVEMESKKRERESTRTDTGVDQSCYESYLSKQAEHRAAKR